jgi:dGTPase
MINRQVTDLVETSRRRIEEAGAATLDTVRVRSEPLIGFSPAMAEWNLALKQFLRQQLYRHYRVRRMSVKADRIVKALFGAFMEDSQILPPEYQQKSREREQAAGVAGRARVVADYIAGMTDRYAIGEYERLFDPSRLT